MAESGGGGGITAAGLAVLFGVGAVGGLIGDMCHVESGTTVYLEDPLPYVWKSQLWFPLMVGTGTAALGWIRVRVGGEVPRGDGDGERLRRAALMIGAVIGLYAVTALVRGEPQPAAITLVYAIALVIAAAFATGPGDLVCACLAALFGVGTEIVLAAADVFAYAGDIGRFAGVATWLPGLYLAYGVVAGQLGLLLADRETG
ncbi:MAG: hypothetical protein U0R51_02305 [Solirubrobacterales bacterium]